MTKDNQITQYTVPRTKRCSKIRASAPRRSNAYYEALINTTLYNPRLGSKEAHEARYQARLAMVHSETIINQSIRQEAAKDLRLHGQSLVIRRVAELSIPTTKTHCECLINDLICLKDCK